MQKVDMQQMIIRFYKGFFSSNWGENWYASSIRPLIESAIENEAKYNKETTESLVMRLRNEDYESYELIIETQIGLVLILCQTYITRVVSRVGYFYKDYEGCFNKKLLKIDRSKQALLANYGPHIKGVEYSSVEIIDALANYFKHHEEWGGAHVLSANEKRTANVIGSAGADLGQTLWYARNLTKCVRVLGVNSMKDLFLLPKIVDDWKFDIGKVFPELELTQE